jgi:hypothetical protein
MYESGAPLSLAKDITIALIARNAMALSTDDADAAKWAGETYKIVLKAIMEAANDTTTK